MYQNKDISPDSLRNTYKIDNKARNELSKANFKFGNCVTDFRTMFQNDFEIKNQNQGKKIDTNLLKKNLRNHSYVMGDHLLDYTSDNKLRFENPNMKKNAV